MSDLDRIEIAFTSDVPEAFKRRMVNAIAHNAKHSELWLYESINKATGAYRIEITAHDRTTIDLTDGQVVERLRNVAASQGMNVKELLRKLASENADA